MSAVIVNLVTALVSKYGESAIEHFLAILHLVDATPEEIEAQLVKMRETLAKPGTQMPTAEELEAQIKAAILAAQK